MMTLTIALAAAALCNADAFQPPSSLTSVRSCASLRPRPPPLLSHEAEGSVDLRDEIAITSRTPILGVRRPHAAAKRARSQKARETWSTIALQPTSRNERREIPLVGESTVVRRVLRGQGHLLRERAGELSNRRKAGPPLRGERTLQVAILRWYGKDVLHNEHCRDSACQEGEESEE